MAFAVEIKRRDLRIIERLDQKRKKALLDAVLVLKDNPVPFRHMDVVKLRGSVQFKNANIIAGYN